VRLAVGGDEPRIVSLERMGEGPDVHYAALLEPDDARRKLTLVVKDPQAKTRVSLVGLRKGHALYTGPEVRRLFWVKKGWGEQAAELRQRVRPTDGADDDPDSASGGKVTICHIPPGNPANRHTITVGASAVDAHLRHGDHKGPCQEGAAASGGKGKSKGKGKGKGKGKKK
jgi:hypothetical protein